MTAQPEPTSPVSGAPLPRRTRLVFGTVGMLLLVAAAMGVYQSLTGPREPTLREPRLTMQKTLRPLPDLGMRDADGKPVPLERFRGKAMLLNLWAAWCGPCRTEMPALDRLQAKYGGPRFEVVALSIDSGGVKAVREFYDALKIRRLAVYIESEKNVLTALGAPGIPTTLLIDAEGREVGRYVGAADWDSDAFEQVLRPYMEGRDGR
jgi:thiol-disulfide isomerase/thioredoxin